MRGGETILAHLPGGGGQKGGGERDELGAEEVVQVVQDLVASQTVSLRCVNSHVVLFSEDGRVSVGAADVGGLDGILVIVDDEALGHNQQLLSQGYTVVKVLGVEEAREVRDTLDRIVSKGVENGLFYSNGYQVRVPDVAIHDSVFSELLVHPLILYLVRTYLGKSARAATWSSNTLLPHMDHAVLGWHTDYPYHDIEPGTWPELPLGVQVMWMIDEFRNDNGATMFFPGSHLTMNPPVFDEFDEPDGAQTLCAPSGSVLIAHSAWWHRQTANTSPLPRHALLASYTRGYVVPKADMQGQLLALMASPALWESLDLRQQHELRCFCCCVAVCCSELQ